MVADDLGTLFLKNTRACVIPMLVAIDHVSHGLIRDLTDRLAHIARILDTDRIGDDHAFGRDHKETSSGKGTIGEDAGRPPQLIWCTDQLALMLAEKG